MFCPKCKGKTQVVRRSPTAGSICNRMRCVQCYNEEPVAQGYTVVLTAVELRHILTSLERERRKLLRYLANRRQRGTDYVPPPGKRNADQVKLDLLVALWDSLSNQTGMILGYDDGPD